MHRFEKRRQFLNCIDDLLGDPKVLSMRSITQHVNVNCFEHSLFVSYISFLMCRSLRLDYVAGARGALLHDLFLYDRKKESARKRRHWTTHPRQALKNASENFVLSDKEKDIIVKHMWPLTLKLPRFRESFIVSLADKICAVSEASKLYKLININEKLFVKEC